MRGNLCGRRKKGREGEKRKSNGPPFFSSPKSPAPFSAHITRSICEQKTKRILVFSLFKPRNPEDEAEDDDQATFDQRGHTKTNIYVIYDHDCHLTANERKRKMAEFFRCAVGPQLYRIFTRNSRQVSLG